MHIADIPVGDGTLGLTLCPGILQEPGDASSPEERMRADLEAIRTWGAAALVSLIEDHEFEILNVMGLGAATEARDMDWYHLPITNYEAPDAWFDLHWVYAGARLHALLRAGRKIVLHCRAGYERTGTVAARLLVERGEDPATALQRVRTLHAGMLEDEKRIAYINARTEGVPGGAWGDRVLGCLLGGALGDGLGYAVADLDWPAIQRQHGAGGLQTPLYQNGDLVVSSDTQLTLFTLEGLLRADRDNPDSVVREIRMACRDWYQTQVPTAVHAGQGELRRYKELQHRRDPDPACLSRLADSGTGMPTACRDGGGVMHTAPLGLVPQWDLATVLSLAAQVAAITHDRDDRIGAASAVAGLVHCLSAGQDLPAAIQTVMEAMASHPAAATAARAMRDVQALHRENPESDADTLRHLGGGPDALAAGLYAALRGTSFPDAVTLAANHDGRSDAAAALAGQLYGAWHGMTCLPNAWVRRLDVLQPICHLLSEFLHRNA